MKKTLLFLIFFLQFFTISAQNLADVEHNFGPRPGFGGGVTHMLTQPDGKIIINGSGYRNAPSKVLIRLNPDGSVDPTFNYIHDINFTIKCLALQPDGKILIGGNDYYGKTWAIRLNEDGSKDDSFQIEVVIQIASFVNSITLQPDGKILIANDSSSRNLSSKYLIRLNANGSVDTTFNIGTGFDDNLDAVAVQGDGKIIVGGHFSTFRGVKETEIVRLNPDGTKDTSFITGTGFPGGGIYSIVMQNDGKVIIGGGFSSYQGVAQKYLIRLNADGSKDTSFTTPTDFQIMNYQSINKISLQPDGKLIVNFYKYNDNDTVYRFNADGSFDGSFPGASFKNGANLLSGKMEANVLSIALLNNGKILIGGDFTYCRQIIDRGIVCLNADGSRDSSFNKDTGFDASVYCSAVQTDGKTLVGGYFDNFQGVTQKKLIRLNLDGSKDTSFNPQFQFNDEVQSILLQSDGKIFVRGKFTDYGVSGRSYLVRLNPDGTLDSSFIKTFGYDYNVEVIALQPDGKILLSGFVDNYPNLPYRKLFRLNIDGTQDISFTAGYSSDFTKGISSIVAQPDGKILVGGAFATFNGIAQKYLVRLNPDGSKDTSFDIGTLYDFAIGVGNLTLQPDGKILVAGLFSPTNGDYQNYLIRLNADGSKDPSFTQSVGQDVARTGYGIEISSLVLQPDGKILVGGEFDTFQGISTSRLTRLNTDGTIDTSFDTGNRFPAPIYSLSLFPDGKINVSGVFSSYKGFSSSYIIRLKGTPVTPSVNATTIQTNAACIGSATGSASIINVYDGKAPYTYLWSNGATTKEVTGLTAGNYSCKITDSESSTITKNFIIITDADIQEPTIKAPAAVMVNANVDCTATGVVLGVPVASDNCSIASVTNDAPAVFPVGNTTVNWTAKDASGNVGTSTQIITVKDATFPTITAPAAVTVNLPNTGCFTSAVTLGTPVTGDNCSVASVTNNNPRFFDLGTTIVTWTVKDKSNNTATATQKVTVKDVTPPTITAPAAVVVNTTLNCKATGVALGTPVTRDNCSVGQVTNNAPASFPIGETIVTWTVKDASNNSSTAKQIVTVKGLDITVTNSAGTLSVAETGAVYKWFICDNGTSTVIPNEINSNFTPKKSGSYAVEVTKNGCSLTSPCFVMNTLGTKDFDLENSLKLFPNPTKEFVTIETNALNNTKLKIFDVNGQFILSKVLKTNSNTVNISHLASGVYIFEISNDNGKAIKKVIKK
ncbi:hypothetical protein BXU11_01590 [Flavobacterium sp. LM5]|uniref:HYR domain-containing protein n=1 Tax=Flavobacterium sp. LM5 TaxID=1938610 RepID=UPI000991DC36|nr:HYR domain-containing protein [Flavobacterium sp. LM5]OOV28670.1 hypothetical protein BXU11_01590 [Flavobacterium sp. LM5]